MDKLHIIYVDDQREVLATLERDLAVFDSYCFLEECESAEEALKLINEIDAKGDSIAIIISDHVMPEKNGVELLTEIHHDDRFKKTKKVLLTGQATHQDTILAINNAGIKHYFEKPWNAKELVDEIKKLLTEYIMESGIDYSAYSNVLDTNTLYKYLHRNV
jgi:two-component system chemotaxis response regulator CheY